mmetsp:Transcript_25696/g.74327  ORF Transcript_25696/g.74327 Transcript_25696/m.74327 type:complete len:203 (-) Transcript_25696:1-609(-)
MTRNIEPNCRNKGNSHDIRIALVLLLYLIPHEILDEFRRVLATCIGKIYQTSIGCNRQESWLVVQYTHSLPRIHGVDPVLVGVLFATGGKNIAVDARRCFVVLAVRRLHHIEISPIATDQRPAEVDGFDDFGPRCVVELVVLWETMLQTARYADDEIRILSSGGRLACAVESNGLVLIEDNHGGKYDEGTNEKSAWKVHIIL